MITTPTLIGKRGIVMSVWWSVSPQTYLGNHTEFSFMLYGDVTRFFFGDAAICCVLPFFGWRQCLIFWTEWRRALPH